MTDQNATDDTRAEQALRLLRAVRHIDAKLEQQEERAAKLDALDSHRFEREERAKRHAKRTVDAEERPPSAPLRALTVRELYDAPAPQYLIDQLLPAGALAEGVGSSEALKSFLYIHIGASIASGRRDVFGLQIVKSGAVLYIAAEGGGAFQYRLRAWGQHHRVDLTTVPFFTITAPLDLRDPAFQEQLRAIIAAIKPVLIIVDTLHRATPGAEENSAHDVGEVISFSARMQHESGATVLPIHHPPKNDPNGDGRGSGALYNAADTVLHSSVQGKEHADGTKVVQVDVRKQKDDAKVSLLLKNIIVPVCDERGRPLAHASGRPITSCVLVSATDVDRAAAVAQQGTQLADDIVTFLRDHPGATSKEIRANVKAKQERVDDVLADLIAAQQIAKTKVQAGKAYRYEHALAMPTLIDQHVGEGL